MKLEAGEYLKVGALALTVVFALMWLSRDYGGYEHAINSHLEGHPTLESIRGVVRDEIQPVQLKLSSMEAKLAEYHAYRVITDQRLMDLNERVETLEGP